MENLDRVHRPNVEQRGPNRSPTAYLREAIAGDAAPARPEAAGRQGDPVLDGVRTGYSVIEEQIQHGQRLAQRLRQGTAALSGDDTAALAPLIGRALNLYKDLGALCLDAVESLARSPVLRSATPRGMAGRAEAGADSADARGGAGERVTYALEINAPGRTSVTLELQPALAGFEPFVHALHSTEPGVAPLTAARFVLPAGARMPVLHLDIPPGQPHGAYTGVVVDRTTNAPCGTLSVRIFG